jgi:hypothetical protein
MASETLRVERKGCVKRIWGWRNSEIAFSPSKSMPMGSASGSEKVDQLGDRVTRPQRQRAHVIDSLAQQGELAILRLEPRRLTIDYCALLVEQPAHVVERHLRAGRWCSALRRRLRPCGDGAGEEEREGECDMIPGRTADARPRARATDRH